MCNHSGPTFQIYWLVLAQTSWTLVLINHCSQWSNGYGQRCYEGMSVLYVISHALHVHFTINEVYDARWVSGYPISLDVI